MTIPFVNQQPWAFVTLEAYNRNGYRAGYDVPFYYDFPADMDVKMTNISLTTGTSPAALTWSPAVGQNAFWGENAVVVSNNSAGNGEVDLYFHSAGPEINGSSGYSFTAAEKTGGGWLEAAPGRLVTVTVSASGAPGYGPYAQYFYLPSGVTFTNGATQLSCSGTSYCSASAQFYMTSYGTIDWTGVFDEPNTYGGGSVSVN